ncbi:MAPEG family protein [Legionella sp. CNM-4043-24]|uniref:MAPEG family protein n=1 Tax=Legionella sp. CNM-4043-24 TaxID=3421646 RepID=UPI00403B15B0
MSTLIICLFIATLLPYLARVPVALAMNKAPGGYNNDCPREQQASLKGFGARAIAAHQNSFEALLVFSTAALTAIASNHVTPMVQYLAIVFIISRLVYHALYLMNMASLRSLVWFIGLVCSLTILGSCI